MEMIIRETNERKELNYIDYRTGADNAEDIIGNSGAIGNYITYDEDAGAYLISEDDYVWWCEYFDNAMSDSETLEKLREEYDDGEIDNIIDRIDPVGSDYNEHHANWQTVFTAIREELTGIYSSAVSDSSAVYDSTAVCDSEAVCDSFAVSDGYGVSKSYGVIYGYGVGNSYGVSNGVGVSNSLGIRDGFGIRNSFGIHSGYGVSNSSAVHKSKFCRGCEGISRCILCYDTTGKLMIFNKPVTVERFNAVWRELGNWYPKFTNAEELKEKYGGGKWEATPIPALKGRTPKEAYAEMPDELREYIKAMPEYDEAIFKAITEATE